MDREQRQKALDLYHRVTRDPEYLRFENMEAAQIVAFLGDALIHMECQEQRIEGLENAVRMADENIGWVTDASADRHVKEVLRKALS